MNAHPTTEEYKGAFPASSASPRQLILAKRAREGLTIRPCFIRIDPAILAARDETIRESWIKAMETRIVREELQKCHKSEGVNHYQVCHELAQKYMNMLKESKVSS